MTVDLPNKAQIGNEYSYTLVASDIDSDPVTFAVDSVPTGYSIVGDQVSWTPETNQLGPHWLRIIASDGNGGYDTLEYGIIVVDSIASIGRVSLNKTLYTGESDVVIFTVNDYDLDLSQSQRDSVQVNFSSTSDPGGIHIWLHESSLSSAEFTGIAGFSTISSTQEPPVLLIKNNDTVFVTYSDSSPVREIMDWGRWFTNCCVVRGNVDGQVGPSGAVDVTDLSYLVAYLFQGGTPPSCEEEGNVDGITGIGEPIDVADLTYLVAYLFQGGTVPPACE